MLIINDNLLQPIIYLIVAAKAKMLLYNLSEFNIILKTWDKYLFFEK